MDELRFFILITIVGLPSLILWVIMLSILSKKGIDVNYSFVRIAEYKLFFRLMKDEPSTSKKVKFFFIFWTQIVLILLFRIGGVIML